MVSWFRLAKVGEFFGFVEVGEETSMSELVVDVMSVNSIDNQFIGMVKDGQKDKQHPDECNILVSWAVVHHPQVGELFVGW